VQADLERATSVLEKFGAVKSHMQFASDEATVEKIWQARKV
jgi:hypothetical protein